MAVLNYAVAGFRPVKAVVDEIMILKLLDSGETIHSAPGFWTIEREDKIYNPDVCTWTACIPDIGYVVNVASHKGES
jgi:hypothetical protein